MDSVNLYFRPRLHQCWDRLPFLLVVCKTFKIRSTSWLDKFVADLGRKLLVYKLSTSYPYRDPIFQFSKIVKRTCKNNFPNTIGVMKKCPTAPNDTCCRFWGILGHEACWCQRPPLLLGCWSIKNGEVRRNIGDWNSYYAHTTVLEGKDKQRCSIGCLLWIITFDGEWKGVDWRSPTLRIRPISLWCAMNSWQSTCLYIGRRQFRMPLHSLYKKSGFYIRG